jgi:serine protease AprX
MKRFGSVWLARFAALLITGSAALGQTQKIAAELQNTDPRSSTQVIVQFDKDPTDADHQKVFSRGGVLRVALHSVKAGAYTMPASALSDLAKDPNVVHISQDHKVFAHLDYTAAAINAPAAWQSGWTGAGVGVALIDSGVSANPDITERDLVYQQNFVPGEGAAGVNDLFGHGMHIAGIIASNGTSSSCSACTRTLKGVAPNANLINLRVLDENGHSADSTVIAAIEAAIQLKDRYNIRVMNLSLGRPVYESYRLDPLCQAVEAAWKAGIVVVVAAGNDGRDNSAGTNGYYTITAPGNDPYVITVGAMKTMGTYDRSDDLIASYSSKGPTAIDDVIKPDIVAPGNRVVSLLAPGTPTLEAETGAQGQVPYSYYENPAEKGASNRYLLLSGTSMAAGVVSGAVADLLQQRPNFTPDQVKALLMRSAYKVFPASSVATDPATGISYTSYYDVFTRGAGYLDIAAALQSKDAPASGSALSPSVNYDSMTNKGYLVLHSTSVWNDAGVWQRNDWTPVLTWGTGVVGGDRSLWSESAVLSARTIWGESATTSAERTIWGESLASSATPSSDTLSVLLAGEP